MSTNPLTQSICVDEFDENDLYEEVNNELFKTTNKIQQQILELMKTNVKNFNIIKSSSDDDSISSENDPKNTPENSSEDKDEESEDFENLHDIEKNMSDYRERSCCDTLTELFLLHVALPVFFFIMNIPFLCKVYYKELITFGFCMFGLLVFGLYIYYILESMRAIY